MDKGNADRSMDFDVWNEADLVVMNGLVEWIGGGKMK